jgi:hypothetical protein
MTLIFRYNRAYRRSRSVEPVQQRKSQTKRTRGSQFEYIDEESENQEVYLDLLYGMFVLRAKNYRLTYRMSQNYENLPSNAPEVDVKTTQLLRPLQQSRWMLPENALLVEVSKYIKTRNARSQHLEF